MPQHIPGLGLRGLNQDTPRHATGVEYFNEGMNMRVLDGQLQGVPSFTNNTDLVFGGTIGSSTVTPTGIYNIVQQTPPGSNFFNIVALVETNTGLQTLVINEANLNTVARYDLPSLPTSTPFRYSEEYGADVLVFNEVLVVNTGTTEPLYASAGAETSGDLRVLPNWFSRNADSGTTPGTLSGTAIVSRKMAAWNDRLVAMNFAGGANEPIAIGFSSTIRNLDSLLAVQWTTASTNDASRYLATETPGAVIDGGSIGIYFAAYKEDSVIIFQDAGNGDIVDVNRLEDDGLFSSNCFIDLGDGTHAVLGNYGFYTHNGTSKENIARGIIEESLYADIAPATRDRTFLYHQKLDKEIWICYRSVGTTGVGCDSAYVWNYKDNTFYKRSLNNFSSVMDTEFQGSSRIFGCSPSNPNLQELRNDLLVSDGFVQFEKESFGNPEMTKSIHSIYPGSMNQMRIGLRPSDNLSSDVSFSSNDLRTWDPTDYRMHWRMKGRYFDLYLGMNGATNPEFSGIQIEATVRGRRG